jgi:hypothetical protein
MRHIGEGLMDRLDDALSEALERVRDGDATKASVTLAFTISVDDEGEEEATYTLKAARGAKGEWRPGSGQPRLPLLDEDGQLKGTGRLLAEHLAGKQTAATGAEPSLTHELVDALNAEGIAAEVVTR